MHTLPNLPHMVRRRCVSLVVLHPVLHKIKDKRGRSGSQSSHDHAVVGVFVEVRPKEVRDTPKMSLSDASRRHDAGIRELSGRLRRGPRNPAEAAVLSTTKVAAAVEATAREASRPARR